MHFFHEKIPSRQLAECTSLQPLDEVIADRPSEGEPLRTRAVTKIFKENYVGAAQDLTAALQLCRYRQSQHKADRQQLQLASLVAAEAQRNSRWKEEAKLSEEDHPSSLESQLLFHRAAVYLTVACQHVSAALPIQSSHKNAKVANGMNGANGTNIPDGNIVAEEDPPTPAEQEAQKRRLGCVRLLKQTRKGLCVIISHSCHILTIPQAFIQILRKILFVRSMEPPNGFQDSPGK